MAILTIILGVVLIIGGFRCLFTPFASFLAAGYIIGIMLFIYGIISLIREIQTKAGILAYITSVLAIIVGFFAMTRPGGTLAIDMMILDFVAIWFLIQGVTGLVISIGHRHEIPFWGLGVVSGIFGIIAGIISLINPAAEMFAVGTLIAIYMIETGLGLITVGSVFGSIKEHAHDTE
ncbi:MAG: DUF308 domain-containing protein [Eubacterium sp.]|nr:DUF308 domain-containing protein [Eubacterium sp.]